MPTSPLHQAHHVQETLRLRLTAPELSARLDSAVAASTIARLVASGTATSKAELTRVTALPRSTVSGCVDALLESGVLEITGIRHVPGRGRPADLLALTGGSGAALLADVGVHQARLAIVDLGQTVLGETTLDIDIGDRPEKVIATLIGAFDDLLARTAAPSVRTVVIGLPGPVDPVHGCPVRPPIMPGWDGYPVADAFTDHYQVPTLVENDVNLCALGEARALPPDQCPLLFVIVDAGIGGGLVTGNGELHHGADGAAGDIGHLRVPNATEVQCACGNIGCIEAVASAGAIVRTLRALDGGPGPASITELVELLRVRDPDATRLVRESAAVIGEMVAFLVHCYNPARIVLGGPITEATDDILAGVRAVVYQRALPLATRNLVLAHSTLRSRAAIAGATVLGIEHALSPDSLSWVRS